MIQQKTSSSKIKPFLHPSRMPACSSVPLLLVVVHILILGGGSHGCAEITGKDFNEPDFKSFSVYALSRGKGVPDEARTVLESARTLLKAAREKGEVTGLTDRRIGLEGETRLCAEFKSAETAAALFLRLRRIGEGVDLINIKIESCPP